MCYPAGEAAPLPPVTIRARPDELTVTVLVRDWRLHATGRSAPVERRRSAMIFRRKESKPKSKYFVGQDVYDSQEVSLGQIVAINEGYIEIADRGGTGSGKSMYVPNSFISDIPRGDTIFLTVTKAQSSVKSWDKPPQ
jgi:hypothetical protein